MRTLDDMQQRLETGVRPQSTLGDLVAEMIDPLTGVGRLLKDMKRQVTGFAIESGFSGPWPLRSGVSGRGRAGIGGRCLCGGGGAGRELPPVECCGGNSHRRLPKRSSVAWYESQADRLSMQLLKKIFGDDDAGHSRCSYRWRNSSRKSTVWLTRRRASTRRCEPADAVALPHCRFARDSH
jgi:hypothetical protein